MSYEDNNHWRHGNGNGNESPPQNGQGHGHDLIPIEPQEALDAYLEDKEDEHTEATLYSHSSRLGHFVRYCEDEGIDNLNDLTPRVLRRYKSWRKEDAGGDLAPSTIKTQLDTLRVFIRWCERDMAVAPNLSTYVDSPALDKGQNVRNVRIKADEAEALLSYLEKFHYASHMHTMFLLLWKGMLRRGGLRTIDVEDFHYNRGEIDIQHRPDEDTPIKKGVEGERTLLLDDETCDVIQDYIETNRHDVTDDEGRNPLITTEYGRMTASTITNYVYGMTRPCFYSGECPHDREIEECEAASDRNDASKCPSSVSPHSIRKGAVTQARNEDIPLSIISDRANASEKVLNRHYDLADEEEQKERRRKYFG